MQPYEKFYYGGQTEARGLLSSESLRIEFKRRAVVYDELLRGFLPNGPKLRALDLACGYGNFLYYLQEKGIEASGIDFDPKQVQLAKSIGLSVNEGDVFSVLEKAVAPYDIISAFDLLEHLNKNNAVKLIKICRECLTAKGILIIQCPCADGFRGAHHVFNDLTHQWAATSNVLRQMLVTAGYSKVVSIDLSLPPFPKSISSKGKRVVRNVSRRIAGLGLSFLGIQKPQIWSDSQIAVAWK